MKKDIQFWFVGKNIERRRSLDRKVLAVAMICSRFETLPGPIVRESRSRIPLKKGEDISGTPINFLRSPPTASDSDQPNQGGRLVAPSS